MQPMLPEDEADPNWDIPTEKTEQQKTAFARIVAAIHDFVLFLQHLYVPEEAIRVPPEGGWPEITKETWTSFGKSDEVIEVLRHLTYIRSQPRLSDPYQFLPNSGLCDFRSRYIRDKVTSGKGREIAMMTELFGEPVRSYVVGLIFGGLDARMILLNCREGLVYGEGDREGGWYEGEKQTVEDYFAELKEQYRQMKLLPFGNYKVIGERYAYEGPFEALKQIFQKHGWPDHYNRDDCVAEITEFGTAGNLLKLAGFD